MASPAVRTTTAAATTAAGFIQRPGCSPSPSTSNSKTTTSSPEPVMPSLPELSTVSPTTDYLDEFSQFDQTFGSYESSNSKSNGENNNNCEENECCDSMNENSGSSMWDVMLSLYLPVLLLWLRRSMFGTANLVRSLVLGHCLRLLFGNVSGWMSEKMTPSWLASLTIHSSSSSHHGKGVDSWPPPALVALALLTIFTLVVHPDGLTWIMLGKLRDAMMSFFQYSTECWNLVVQDYGVIPTFAAAATFAVLLFLFFCIGRTLRRARSPSKSTTPHHPPERKKKKRKGHARHRGGGSGGANHNSGTRIKSSSRERPERQSDNHLPDLTPVSTASTRTTIDSTFDPCPPPEMEPPESGALSTNPSSSTNIASTSVPCIPSSPSGRPLQQNEKEKQQQQQQRSRLTSVSTADTTTLSDDQSCESSSVRSIPSVSVGSTRSHDLEKQQHSSKQQSQHAGSKQAKSNTPSNRRNKKKGKHHPKHNAPLSSENPPLVASSRWDALKPTQPSHGHYNSNNHGNNNTNHNHQYQHQNQTKHHHGRGGGGGRNNRKPGGGGRHQQFIHQHQQQQQPAANNANNFFSSKNANAVGVARPPPKLSVTSKVPNQQLRAPVSPPNITKPMMKLPPPPPGLGPLPSSAVPLPALGGSGCNNGNSNNSMMTTMSTLSSNGTSAPTPSFFENHHHLTVNRAAAAISVASSSSDSTSGGNSLKYVSDSFLNGGDGLLGGGTSCSANRQHHQRLKLKENPFESEDRSDDSKIEADLQKLGGQMAGSILDF